MKEFIAHATREGTRSKTRVVEKEVGLGWHDKEGGAVNRRKTKNFICSKKDFEMGV